MLPFLVCVVCLFPDGEKRPPGISISVRMSTMKINSRIVAFYQTAEGWKVSFHKKSRDKFTKKMREILMRKSLSGKQSPRSNLIQF